MQTNILPSFVFLLLLLSGIASAQLNFTDLTAVLASLPECSRNCSAIYVPLADCPPADLLNCICKNETLRYQIRACEYQACDLPDLITTTIISQDKVCKGIPTPWIGYQTILASIIIGCITYPIIALRFYTRIYITRKLWWDDWSILFVTFFLVPNTLTPIYLSYYGLGTHFWDVSPAYIPRILKMYYSATIFNRVVENIPKISILLLYLRIFPTPRFRTILYIAMAWQTAHTIAFVLAITFHCVPVASIYDPLVRSTHCINLNLMTYIEAGLSIAESLVIILLPVHELRSLNLGCKKKVGLVLMFALASGSVVANMIRLKFLVGFGTGADLFDPTWQNVRVIICSQIESFLAVICSCLICTRPFFQKYTPRLFSASRTFKSTAGTPATPKTPGTPGTPSSNRWIGGRPKYGMTTFDEGDIDLDDFGITTRCSVNNGEISGSRSGLGLEDWEGKDGIMKTVEHTVEVESEHSHNPDRKESEESEVHSRADLNPRFALDV